MTILSETRPRARRAHRCCLCYEPILAGERHDAQVSVYDGRVETVRSHLGCFALATRLCEPDDENAYEDGCIVMAFADCTRDRGWTDAYGRRHAPSAADVAYTTTARVILAVIYAAARTRGAAEVTP